jgi:hypothetical protein
MCCVQLNSITIYHSILEVTELWAHKCLTAAAPTKESQLANSVMLKCLCGAKLAVKRAPSVIPAKTSPCQRVDSLVLNRCPP